MTIQLPLRKPQKIQKLLNYAKLKETLFPLRRFRLPRRFETRRILRFQLHSQTILLFRRSWSAGLPAWLEVLIEAARARSNSKSCVLIDGRLSNKQNTAGQEQPPPNIRVRSANECKRVGGTRHQKVFITTYADNNFKALTIVGRKRKQHASKAAIMNSSRIAICNKLDDHVTCVENNKNRTYSCNFQIIASTLSIYASANIQKQHGQETKNETSTNHF